MILAALCALFLATLALSTVLRTRAGRASQTAFVVGCALLVVSVIVRLRGA
jgi:hypothetical protein